MKPNEKLLSLKSKQCREFYEVFFGLDKDERLGKSRKIIKLTSKQCREYLAEFYGVDKDGRLGKRLVKNLEPVIDQYLDAVDQLDSLYEMHVNRIYDELFEALENELL